MADQGDNLPAGLFEFPDHVKLNYDAVLAEPPYYQESKMGQALAPVSRCLETTNDSIQIVLYYILSATFGAVLAVWWGLIFGIIQFFTVWVVQPFIKVWLSLFRCSYIMTRSCTRMTCDPCFESMAIAYTTIRGGFTIEIDHKAEPKLEELRVL